MITMVVLRSTGWTWRRDGERGSASLWVLTAGALVIVIALAAASRMSAVAARHRAETAADLAALAAAGGIGVDGTAAAMCQRADRIAALNAAALQFCRIAVGPDGRTGTATVGVAVTIRLVVLGSVQVSAQARAGRLPTTDVTGR